jgi:putative membrane protein
MPERYRTVARRIGWLAVACLAAAATPRLDPERTFLAHAGDYALTAIEEGRLAAQRAQDPSLRAYGEAEAERWTAQRAEIEALANQLVVILPTEPSLEHREAIAGLRERSGDDFDEAFLGAALPDAQAALSALRGAAHFANADVARFARRALPGAESAFAALRAAADRLAPSPPGE